MASLASPTPHKLALLVPFSSPSPLRHHPPSQPFSPHPRVSDSAACRCRSSSSFDSSSPRRSWESSLGDAVRAAVERVDRFFNLRLGNLLGDSPPRATAANEEPDWDWERWSRHFLEVEEQERLVSVLKPELDELVRSEEFENAARLKVAIAAASTKDVVGRAIHELNRALEEERYEDAAFIRDNAGAGLVGWWSGIAKESGHARGMIIRITAEHGRYLARRYTPRQLQIGAPGIPLFEIFLRVSKKGEYKRQAVYLKQAWSLNTKKHYLDATDDLLVTVIEDEDSEKDDVADPSPESSALNKALKDTNPGAKVRILKVTAPGKVDKDLISKVIEQILDEGDEEEDDDIENLDVENGNNDGINYLDSDMIELEASTGVDEIKECSEIARNVVVGDLIEEARRGKRLADVLRVPAKLEKEGNSSFSFFIDKDASEEDSYDEKVVQLVAFRAKIGKGYQLPHRGIIPEEFGVIARYKGQGRLVGAENPPWVEGELVILEGKLVKGGPIVGFIYTEPRMHYLLFLNRLKLQD